MQNTLIKFVACYFANYKRYIKEILKTVVTRAAIVYTVHTTNPIGVFGINMRVS